MPTWRWYGDNGAGVSIGLRSQYFGFGKKVTEPLSDQCSVYTPVLYEFSGLGKFLEFCKAAMSGLVRRVREFSDFCHNNNMSMEQWNIVSHHLGNSLQIHFSSYLLSLLPAIKHPSYKEENENRLYRLEHKVSLQDGGEYVVGKIDDARKFVTERKIQEDKDNPCFLPMSKNAKRYQSDEFSLDDIAEIWVGSRLDFECTKSHIVEYLRNAGYNIDLIDMEHGIHIKQSKMPYR